MACSYVRAGTLCVPLTLTSLLAVSHLATVLRIVQQCCQCSITIPGYKTCEMIAEQAIH